MSAASDLTPDEDAFWFKVVEFLQTNWAVITTAPTGVVIVFLDDGGGIFDRMALPDAAEAERQLRVNGFNRFSEDPRARDFLAPPQPPYWDRRHPNGPIYSSGRFWTR